MVSEAVRRWWANNEDVVFIMLGCVIFHIGVLMVLPMLLIKLAYS